MRLAWRTSLGYSGFDCSIQSSSSASPTPFLPEQPMTLRTEANRLINVLESVCAALEAFGTERTNRYATQLRPLVDQFRRAVIEDRSRDRAEAALRDIKPIMDEISATATKGEMAIFTGGELDEWWELSSIFQESRFSGESL